MSAVFTAVNALLGFGLALASTVPPNSADSGPSGAPDADSGPPAPTTRVEQFRTSAAPRLDPVFGDPLNLRTNIDRFLDLHQGMESTREQFQEMVNQTLAILPRRAPRQGTPSCPEDVADRYRTAHQAGAEFLILGRKLRELFRDIQRADELGDTMGLTPSYRFKAKRAGQLYRGLLTDYREMRVAFHDQLGTEMRYAGCPMKSILEPTPTRGIYRSHTDVEIDPADAMAWQTHDEADAGEGTASFQSEAMTTDTMTAKTTAAIPRPSGGDATTGTQGRHAHAIWIEIDNRKCDQPSRLAIDGVTVGEIPPERQSSVRARAGTRSLCLLPANDRRTCGQPGTLRKTYLYEGLTLRVHCGQ